MMTLMDACSLRAQNELQDRGVSSRANMPLKRARGNRPAGAGTDYAPSWGVRHAWHAAFHYLPGVSVSLCLP
jgi:hypothetical protein